MTPLQREITQLADALVDIQDEQSYTHERERSHRDTTESTNSRVLWFTFLEAATLVCMSLWQVYTILKQFESKVTV